MTALQMFGALFGPTPNTTLANANAYGVAADSCLLPINPNQPGRWKVLRDFRMSVAPGWK